MTWDHHLRAFARRVRRHIDDCLAVPSNGFSEFDELALELFHLQFEHNAAYRTFCRNRGISGTEVRDWTQIPAVPTLAFKELELSSIPPDERTAVFYSSGTTQHRPSRHFHNPDSLDIYQTSLSGWFAANISIGSGDQRVIALTPNTNQAPNSSLVHMFETLRERLNPGRFVFTGDTLPDGSWQLDCAGVLRALQEAEATKIPVLLLGTAFSYVHLLDFLDERQLELQVPAGSCILETGGYKGRSRVLQKSELHALITRRLGVPDSHIVCEYGMSELSSQAYDRIALAGTNSVLANRVISRQTTHPRAVDPPRNFRFPPWARVQIISPETGCEVAEGNTGLLRIFDLANIYSVMAVQTEDLGIRRRGGFELVGRAALAEPRGCSLTASYSE